MAADDIAVRFRIKGKVQGVGYRAWAVERAEGLGLTGWIRNVSDGSVEVVAKGPKAVLEVFFAAAHAGPESSRVREVKHENVPADEAAALPPGFHQLATKRP